jgi:protein TonB
MKLLLISALFLGSIGCEAQSSTTVKPDTATKEFDKTYTKVSRTAYFPGGTPAWKAFLGKNLRYPDAAVNDEIHGDIVVQFDVDEEGNTSNIQAISGPKKGGLREEAVRMITLSGKWEPAVNKGVKVKATIKETISFKLVK